MFKIDRRNVKICEPIKINFVPAPKDAGTVSDAVPEKTGATPAAEKKRPASTGPTAEEIISAARIQAQGMLARAREEAVEKAEAEAEARSREIISEARQQAEEQAAEIIRAAGEAARAEADNIREAARKAGYEEGINAARDETDALRRQLEDDAADLRRQLEDEALRRQEELAGQLKTLCDGLSAGQAQMQAAMEESAVSLALGIARKIIGAALEWDTQAYNSLIKTALKQMKRDGKLYIYLSESDCQRLFPDGTASFMLGDTAVTAIVEADPGMETGDCVIESDAELVDAGAGSQLKLAKIAFRKAEAGQ